MRKAFTLIEVLVIIAIIGIMVTVGVLSIGAGQRSVKVKAATRDAFAAIRHARSVALVTQQPAVITYSVDEADGEPIAKLEVVTAKLLDTSGDKTGLQTIWGEPVVEKDGSEEANSTTSTKRELVHIRKAGEKGKSTAAEETETKDNGASIEDILFEPIKPELLQGMRLKVVKDGEDEGEVTTTQHKPRVSVFSNVDFILGKLKKSQAAAKKAEEEKKAAEETMKVGEKTVAPVEKQEPVSIVWETNGRVDPHRVWIYPDGKRPEDGLMIRVDSFGGAKVLPGDGKEEKD